MIPCSLRSNFRNQSRNQRNRKANIAFASIAAERRSVGRPVSQSDGQIAAIARSFSASVATRNVADYEGCGVEILNPWLLGLQ